MVLLFICRKLKSSIFKDTDYGDASNFTQHCMSIFYDNCLFVLVWFFMLLLMRSIYLEQISKYQLALDSCSYIDVVNLEDYASQRIEFIIKCLFQL